MSENRVSPSPSAESPMETHPLKPMDSQAQSPSPATTDHYHGQPVDDGINFGGTKMHEYSAPSDWDSVRDDNSRTVTDPVDEDDYTPPSSVTPSRESSGQLRESGTRSRESVSHSRGSATHSAGSVTRESVTHSRESVTHSRGSVTHSAGSVTHSRESLGRSRESIQHSRESVQKVEVAQSQRYYNLTESPEHTLPAMTDDGVVSEEEVDDRNVYTPALPREKSNINEPRYDSPPPCANSPVYSKDEALPSEKMVPLAPIGSNRVGPLVEEQPQVYPGGSSEYPRATMTRQMSERDLIHKEIRPSDNTDGAGCCGWLLYIFSILLIIVTLPFSLMFTIKVVQEYERAVIFRLGRLPSGGAKGPGIFFIIPCIESYSKVDLRTVSFDVPPQEVLTKDSVTVSVDAVVYYRVSNPTVSVANVENAHHSTRLLAQTTLRNILGTKNMSEILSDREAISHGMQSTLDEATDRWGIKVERVEIKDVRLPVQLQRAMAAEAEAAREARAKVIAAEGEQKASKALKDAADVMCQSSAALQLRYLQTLNSISAEKNSTIIFPLPVDMLNAFLKR